MAIASRSTTSKARGPTSATPLGNSDGCSIISTTIVSSGRQLQAGIYGCSSNFSLSGCPPGQNRFVERFNSGTYTCVLAGGASADTYYAMRVAKIPESSTFQAYVSGNYITALSGFNSPDAYTWGEQFSNSPACDDSWKLRGNFRDWEVRDGQTWKNGSPIAFLGDNASCWNITGTPSSGSYGIRHG